MPDEYIEKISGIEIGENKGTCGTAAFKKEAVITGNIYEDPKWEGFHSLADDYNFSACWSQPILDNQQEVLGTFATYYEEPQSPSKEELNTVERASQIVRVLFESYEKQQAEKALTLSEKRFKSLVQDGSDLIAILDQDAKYKYMSPSYDAILGMCPKKYIGRSADEFIHEEDQDKILNISESLEHQEHADLEPYRFKDAEDNWRWIESTITKMFDNPAIEGIVVNSRDVTESIDREQELKESVERYEYVTRATEDVVYDWDITEDILDWDDSFQNKFVFDIEDDKYDIGYWSQNVHPDDLAETKRNLYEALADSSQSKWEYEYRFKKKNGSYAAIFERGFIIRDEGGKAIRMIGSLQDITERKEYQEKLEELALVASKTTDVIIIMNADERITWVNDAFKQLTEYDFEEVAGKRPSKVLSGPETDPIVQQRISDAMNNQESLQEIILNYAKSGEKYWVDLTIDPILGDEDQCAGFIAIEKDVTEQIERQRELQESVERYDIVSKATSDTIWDLNLETDTNRYNENIYNMFGYEKQEVEKPAEWWREKIHPEDRGRVIRRMDNALDSDSDRFQIEYRFQCADGSYKYIYDRAFIVNDEQGNPIRLIGAMQDVTQQREERKWLQLFESAIASTKEAITIIEGRSTDLQGREILYANNAFAEMTGYLPEEVIGETLHILNGPETSRAARRKLRNAMKQWEACEAEFINYKKSGEEFWVHVSMTPVQGPDNMNYWVCVGRDITDRKEGEEQLVESLKEKETLLLEIHHRVKNNLAVVSGMMQLQAFEEEDESIKNKLYDSVVRIQTMGNIHELLYQSESFTELAFHENLEKLIHQIRDTFNTNTTLETNFDLDRVNLNINQAIPCSLIVNEVVTNVLKHAFKDNETGTLTVSLSEYDDTIHLSVQDDGKGLPPDFEKNQSGQSLGLKLIDTLTSQLEADYEYVGLENGAKFNLEFRKAEIKGIGNAHLL